MIFPKFSENLDLKKIEKLSTPLLGTVRVVIFASKRDCSIAFVFRDVTFFEIFQRISLKKITKFEILNLIMRHHSCQGVLKRCQTCLEMGLLKLF